MEIFRNISRRKLRSFLTISGIVIGVLALTTMGAIAENFNALIDGGIKYYGSNVQVGAPDGQSAALLPTSKIDEIKKVDGVAAAFAGYTFLAKPGVVSIVSFGLPDLIAAADPAENDWTTLKVALAQGHPIDAGSTGQVVLGSTIDKEFNKKIGDTIDLPVRPADAAGPWITFGWRDSQADHGARHLRVHQHRRRNSKGQPPNRIRDQIDVSKIPGHQRLRPARHLDQRLDRSRPDQRPGIRREGDQAGRDRRQLQVGRRDLHGHHDRRRAPGAGHRRAVGREHDVHGRR
jgi:hypothetical protein